MSADVGNLAYLKLRLQYLKGDVFAMSSLRRLVYEERLDVGRLNDDEVIRQAAHILNSGSPFGRGLLSEAESSLRTEALRMRARVTQRESTDIVYFEMKSSMDRVEFERALKMAEAEINQLTPQTFLDRLSRLESFGAGVQRDKTAQAAARKAGIGQYKGAMPFLFDMLREEYRQLTTKEAASSLAREVGGSRFRNLHIEHRLDIGGGGLNNKFAGLGDARINSFIGSQWAEQIPLLRRFAEEARKRGRQKMAVEFCIKA